MNFIILLVSLLAVFCTAKAVKTKDGGECIFPFLFQGRTYYSCAGNEGSKWCAVENGNYDQFKKWDYCLEENDYPNCNKMAEPTLTFDEVQKIVEYHNTVRAEISNATRMYKMKWSDELARLAQYRVNECSNEHGNLHKCDGSKMGQNLVYARQPNVYLPLKWEETVLGDFGSLEKKNYDPVANSCSGKICGHYTQTVWGWSMYVGCAKANCISKNESFADAPFMSIHLCNYYYAGNVVNARPFDFGEPCSACDDDYFKIARQYVCENNMCDDCPAGQEDKCIKPLCKDSNPGCLTSFCRPDETDVNNPYYQFTNVLCRRTCQRCPQNTRLA